MAEAAPEFDLDDVYPVGRVRVGRCDYRRGCQHGTVPGFTPILCISKDPVYSALSPFRLRDATGVLVENRWQFSKIYQKVPKIIQKCWQSPAETHMDAKGVPTEEYWAWRRKGFMCRDPVRFPAGREMRKHCKGAIKNDNKTKDPPRLLGYVESRREIYVPKFTEAAKRSPVFLGLRQRLLRGENLLIIDIDGPHKAAMKYYKKKYGVPDDFIDAEGTIEATESNLKLLLGDELHPFGHGFCIAAALQGITL
jgi:hypothetical protein